MDGGTLLVEKIKLVFVGDAGVGKTCLIKRLVENRFDPYSEPTMYDRYTRVIQYKGKRCELVIEDTAGQQEYARLRPIQYTDASVILVCFALASPSSRYENIKLVSSSRLSSKFYSEPSRQDTKNKLMESCIQQAATETFSNVQSYWIPEVNHFLTAAHKKVLLGTKSDLRIHGLPEGTFITHKEGSSLAKKCNCARYVECSASSGYNVNHVLNTAIELHFNEKHKPSRRRSRHFCRFL